MLKPLWPGCHPRGSCSRLGSNQVVSAQAAAGDVVGLVEHKVRPAVDGVVNRGVHVGLVVERRGLCHHAVPAAAVQQGAQLPSPWRPAPGSSAESSPRRVSVGADLVDDLRHLRGGEQLVPSVLPGMAMAASAVVSVAVLML